MSRIMRLFYYGVLGAIGGLIAWQVSNLLGLKFGGNLYLSEIVVGALIGLFIGFFIGLADGLLTRNFIQAGKTALFAGGLGLLGGAVGLPLAEGLFQLLGGYDWSRLIGWGIFGALIGLAIGYNSGSQMWKGALGGALGGVFGSLMLESSRRLLDDPLLGKAGGLVLLGAAVGVFIALIVYILTRAWLKVISGKLKGTEFILDKFLHANGPAAYIGSDALKSDIVLPDPDIAPQHAMIKGTGSGFTLKDMSLNGTFVNDRRIETTTLKNKQVIKMGNTQLEYHEKR